MRPPDTTARGTSTNMSTAVIIAKRICMMYCMKASRLPMGISPLSTAEAPR
jgi:hypothetical protein